MPNSIFIGVDGSIPRLPIHVHIARRLAENSITPSGSTDWKLSGDIDVTVLSRAHKVSVKPFW